MQTRAERKPSTTKRMIVMVLLVLLLIGIIAGIKVLLVMRMMAGMKPPPPAVVSTAKATWQDWQPTLTAVGSLRAARGADLAFEVAGVVTRVGLASGEDVKEGQVLVQLNDSSEVAQLRQLEAAAALSQVTFERARRQLEVKAISQADYDAAAADLKAKQAAVQQQQAVIAKKQLRAPFAGHAGIVTLNPGAYVNSGTSVVTLQQLDPVFVDFSVPQRSLGDLKPGQKITLTLDAFPGKTFDGVLTAINPKVDGDTRTVQAEASVPNPERMLVPGMFAHVAVEVGERQRQLTLPQTAIVYNPYGDTVYVVKPQGEMPAAAGQKAPAAANALVVQQTFVTTGATRGDQVAIVKGVDEDAEIVTSGQIKLKNGAPVTVDNKVQPADNPNPQPQEH
ncbi:MAG: efflux RND transporter periplasmic adaptor subunit [Rhodanobacteraceae bacterium]|jgi:membrane fusion protein (multidrug efflux system)|nr:efflux RND transporter periplasmic adaptor subunit [Rhodanobacteraceae bacterium]